MTGDNVFDPAILSGSLEAAAAVKSQIDPEVAAASAALHFDSYLDLPTMGRNTVEQAVDKINIRELVEMDRWYRDNCQWDKMEQGYLEDSLVTVSWFCGPGREFVQRSAAQAVSATPYTSPKHKIFNTHVWLNGTKAVTETQCVMLSPYGLEYNGVKYTNLSFARLFERVEKVDGYWGIKQFDTIYERGYILPERPCPEFQVPAEELAGFRESYKCVCWELKRLGMEPDNEQPGEDRPDLIDTLYRAASEWVQS